MTGPAVSFDRDYFDRLRAAAGHWWVRGMLRVGKALMVSSDGPARRGDTPLRVLDAGCGSGASLPWLSDLAAPNRVQAVDLAAAALEYCQRIAPDTDLLQASVTDLPFSDAAFDFVVSFDVLQHLTAEQATAAARELCRVLRPGGRVLVRTNAAFGRQRVAQLDDWRLYTPASLRAVLSQAGLAVERLTAVNTLQGLWASRPQLRGRHHGHDDHPSSHGQHHDADGQPVIGLGIPQSVHPLKNRLLLALLGLEARWLTPAGRSLPFGHSLYAVAARPLATAE